MSPSLLERIRTAIGTATGCSVGACEARPVGGGDINESYVLVALTPYFVKVNSAQHAGLFEAEVAALDELAATNTVRVPRPVLWEVWEDSSFLVLEHLALQKSFASQHYRRMGEQLARLHQVSSANHSTGPGASQLGAWYGWHRANFIGTTPQPNAWTESWPDFWREQRLGFQVKLAERKGLHLPHMPRLLERMESFFPSGTSASTVPPCLLHGDLWSGNAAFDEKGCPVLFDPASYYGDRECDLAFTELFGGFPAAFYDAYDATWPRAEGWERRRDLYNLYHLLNHYNLFGGSYAAQVHGMLERLMREM